MKNIFVLLIGLVLLFSCAPKYTASFQNYNRTYSNINAITIPMMEVNTQQVSSELPTKVIFASVEKEPTEFKSETKNVSNDLKELTKPEDRALRKQTRKELNTSLNEDENPKRRGRFITWGIILSLLSIGFLIPFPITWALFALGIFLIVKGSKIPKQTSPIDAYKQSEEYKQTEDYKKARKKKTIIIAISITVLILLIILLLAAFEPSPSGI
jgi:uncharacterized membrane protein